MKKFKTNYSNNYKVDIYIKNKKISKKNLEEVLRRLDEQYGTEKICYL